MQDTTTVAYDTTIYEPPPKEAINTIIKQEELTVQEKKQNDDLFGEPLIVFGFILLIMWLIYKAQKKGPVADFIERYFPTVDNEDGNYYTNVNTAIPQSNDLVYYGKDLKFTEEEITTMLEKYLPYYYHLNNELKQKFTERLQNFIPQKTFIICADGGYKEMPVLLSAAAIQLTFGLEDYELEHYEYIKIHVEEYFADDSLRVLAGHVEDNTITIAWNQFLKGFKDAGDGVNVGLHEMSHALYYQHIVIDNGREKEFCKYYNEVMTEGAEVYELKKTTHILFTDYAFKNLQEFWAESVEVFFERPDAMRANYPDLFNSIKELLQQDPSNKINPLHLQEANV
jgi:Mlc titration factor MtfA (ptsG expression regulator)